MRKTLILQHTDMEVPGSLITWHEQRGRNYLVFKTYLDQNFPELTSFTDLVVLGGPMNVDQEKAYPWLKAEKKFIEKFLSQHKGKYLGICLGGQLLARALGVKVRKNKTKEIGWHTIEKSELSHSAFADWPETSFVFQWHEDTFDLPPGTAPLFKSEACQNQAYAIGDRAIGLQFHPESTSEWIHLSYLDFKEEDHHGMPYVQSREIVAELTTKHLADMQKNFFSFLDKFLG